MKYPVYYKYRVKQVDLYIFPNLCYFKGLRDTLYNVVDPPLMMYLNFAICKCHWQKPCCATVVNESVKQDLPPNLS